MNKQCSHEMLHANCQACVDWRNFLLDCERVAAAGEAREPRPVSAYATVPVNGEAEATVIDRIMAQLPPAFVRTLGWIIFLTFVFGFGIGFAFGAALV